MKKLNKHLERISFPRILLYEQALVYQKELLYMNNLALVYQELYTELLSSKFDHHDLKPPYMYLRYNRYNKVVCYQNLTYKL